MDVSRLWRRNYRLHNLGVVFSIVILGTAACRPPGNLQHQATVTSIPQMVTTMPQPKATPTSIVMSREGLENMPYILPVSGRTVILSGGAYEGGSGADYVLANLGEEMALGDLNGDGLEDAAITLNENTGGSGVFVSLLAVFSEGSVRAQGPSALLGDRVQVNNMSIRDGKILVDLLRQGPNDAMCCPTLKEQQRYEAASGRLVLTHIVAIRQGGTVVEISIEQPQQASEVPAGTRLQGRTTISPFENTLLYQVLDEAGIVLAQGPLMVASYDIGAPGTFDAMIDLSKVQSGSLVWISVSEQSMADGTTMAMDAISVIRR